MPGLREILPFFRRACPYHTLYETYANRLVLKIMKNRAGNGVKRCLISGKISKRTITHTLTIGHVAMPKPSLFPIFPTFAFDFIRCHRVKRTTSMRVYDCTQQQMTIRSEGLVIRIGKLLLTSIRSSDYSRVLIPAPKCGATNIVSQVCPTLRPIRLRVYFQGTSDSQSVRPSPVCMSPGVYVLVLNSVRVVWYWIKNSFERRAHKRPSAYSMEVHIVGTLFNSPLRSFVICQFSSLIHVSSSDVLFGFHSITPTAQTRNFFPPLLFLRPIVTKYRNSTTLSKPIGPLRIVSLSKSSNGLVS